MAVSGSVGNLPKVENMDMQYSQAAVFSPYYFFVSPSVIKSEATPNTEMILVADADLSPLNERHSFGSVHNLRDRRKDVYGLKLLAEDVKTETIMPD